MPVDPHELQKKQGWLVKQFKSALIMTCNTWHICHSVTGWLCAETTVPKGHSVGWIISKFVLFPDHKVPSFPGLETQCPLLCSEKLLQFSIMAYSFAGDISQSKTTKHCTNFSLEANNPAKESSCYWPLLSQLCVLNNYFSKALLLKMQNFEDTVCIEIIKVHLPSLPFVH